jgi:Zn-finger nucleic acid-binding protein
MKICPSCSSSLKESSIENLILDICSDGCGGIWFDMFELKKVDEPSEVLSDELIKLSSKESNLMASSDETLIKMCPCCTDENLIRRSYDIFEQVEVDQCLKCSGIWLDNGEIDLIRSQFKTEEERNQAGDNFVRQELNSVRDQMNDRVIYFENLARENKENNKYTLHVMKMLASFLPK